MSEQLRDTRRPREFWDEKHRSFHRIKSSNSAFFDNVQERLKTSDTIQPVYGLFNYAENFMDVINICYAKGDSLDEIRATYVIPGLGRYRQLVGEIERFRGQMDTEHFYDRLQKPSAIHSAYTLLAWWLCFEADESAISELAPYVAPAGDDRLLDTILHRYQPDREVAEKPSCARSFGVLDQMIDATPDKRIKLAEKYLTNWGKTVGTLKALRSLGIQGESGLKSNEDLNASEQALGLAYKGFWAWELALVVRFFDIDDSSFADNEFYPVDLVRYRAGASE